MITIVAGLLVSACDMGRSVAPPPVAPAASTPAGAAERLAWAFNHSDAEIAAGLLPDDFEFATAGLDSAGNGARDTVLTRDTLLGALRSLLEGVPGVSSPARVTLNFDQNLVPFPDTRPGRDPRVHRAIRTSVDLRVFDPASQSTWEVSGHALFYLTRGDSAVIARDRVALGVHADSTRWWIDRWEDETIGSAGGGGAHANPAGRWTLWQVLRFFLDRLLRPSLLAQRHA
jgi:hypothetical protein